MTLNPLFLVGPPGALADAIAERVGDAGPLIVATDTSEAAVTARLADAPALRALVIVAPPAGLGVQLLDIDDDQLESALQDFLDLFAALRAAIPRLEDGASVVVVNSRGHLGGWMGAHEMAFAGAVSGLLRSVALENMDRGIRANVVATELPASETSADIDAVADTTAFLLSPASAAINGELILANHGNSLRMREARDRRTPRDPAKATPTLSTGPSA